MNKYPASSGPVPSENAPVAEAATAADRTPLACQIEQLLPGDLEEAVTEYVDATNQAEPRGDIDRDHAREALSNEKYTCFVAKSEGKIAGLVVFDTPEVQTKTVPKKMAVIKFIGAVELRKGVGTALMRKLAVHTQELGLERILSTVSIIDDRAMAFYRKCGFIKNYEETVKGDGEPDFILWHVAATPEEILVATDNKGDLTT